MNYSVYYRKEDESLMQKFFKRCEEKDIPYWQVILNLVEKYVEDRIYVPSNTSRSKAIASFISLFKRCCPTWMIPVMNDEIEERIVRAARTESPAWWENVFKTAYDIPWGAGAWAPDFLWLLEEANCFKVLSGRFDFIKAQRDRESRVEERRIKREAEKAEKQRIKEEEKIQKANDKANRIREKELGKLSPEELEKKLEAERLKKEWEEQVEKATEKAKNEPQWNELAYIDEDTGKEMGGWDYPRGWTDEQIVEWELAHEVS